MIRFEVVYSKTRKGYIWRIRDGIIIGISVKVYDAGEMAYEAGQDAMFMYFFAEERRMAKAK